MNLLEPYFLYLKIGALIAILAGLAWYHHHVYQQGYDKRADEQLVIDAKSKAAALDALEKLNAHINEVQVELDKSTASLSTKQTELDRAKQNSNDYQVRLASGADRLHVLTKSNCANQAANPQSTSLTDLDNRTEVTAELDGTVAANLVKLAGEGDEAIARLNACIVSYNLVKTAVDSIK